MTRTRLNPEPAAPVWTFPRDGTVVALAASPCVPEVFLASGGVVCGRQADRERHQQHAGDALDAGLHARAAQQLPEGLSALLWSFAPAPGRPRPAGLADVPATSPESIAMAKELKRRGFVFVGPTTAYALMQATGMVDDHVADCFRAQPAG